VQINVTSASHDYANPTTSDATKLTSGATGLHRILYKPSGTGTKWCIVRLGEQSSAAAVGGTVQIGDLDGTPALFSADTIYIGDGFGTSAIFVTDLGGGDAQVDVANATRTVRGTITLALQNVGDGVKCFQSVCMRATGADAVAGDPALWRGAAGTLQCGTRAGAGGGDIWGGYLWTGTTIYGTAGDFSDCWVGTIGGGTVVGNSNGGTQGPNNNNALVLLVSSAGDHALLYYPNQSGSPSYAVEDAGVHYDGAAGTFTTVDGKTVTVRGGIITSIV
jgi:hypothetical protein